PFPGAAAVLAGDSLKVWGARVSDLPRPPDTPPGQIVAILSEGIAVAAADGVVELTEVQKPGGKRMAVRDFLHGANVAAGQSFEGRAA
ncbi:MAG: methionyl-tRNA formyltransferase, partial [Rhodoferax sp.]|nr:methionyl-tRNA formyltransferase [Rhodoferax sp.]